MTFAVSSGLLPTACDPHKDCTFDIRSQYSEILDGSVPAVIVHVSRRVRFVDETGEQPASLTLVPHKGHRPGVCPLQQLVEP
jgi:hypothetical protein